MKTTKDIVEDLRAIDLQSIMYKLKNYDDVGNDKWVRVDDVLIKLENIHGQQYDKDFMIDELIDELRG